MSLFSRAARSWPVPPIPAPGQAGAVRGSVRVSNETALRHSAVWACLRLRADLVSTMPVDLYRKVDGVRVEVAKPPVLVTPDGSHGVDEWLYATQFDLDRAGNAFGLITARDGMGFPARIELLSLGEVGLSCRDGVLSYRVAGKTVPTADVWHERQYVVPGLAVGLSPIAYAAYSIGSYLSAQEFALDWFGNSATPALQLRNTEKALPGPQAEEVKARAQAAMTPGGLFVSGKDWELNPVSAVGAQAQYVELMQFGVPDIARFFGVPADLIDSGASGSSITYANITQRNLQFLIMHLGPAVTRRENALTKLTPQPRYVKLNRSALLAMDPATRATTLKTQLDSRQITPSEARAVEDRPPLTPTDLAEFDAVYGSPRVPPTGATS